MNDQQRDYAEEASNAREHLDWPAPTVESPDMEDLRDMLIGDGDVSTTDDCYGVEPDGTCEHGYPSWPLYLGLI